MRQGGDATYVWPPNPAEVAEDEPVSMTRSGREEAVLPSAEPGSHPPRKGSLWSTQRQVPAS